MKAKMKMSNIENDNENEGEIKMLNIIFNNLILSLSYGAKSYAFYKLYEYCLNLN